MKIKKTLMMTLGTMMICCTLVFGGLFGAGAVASAHSGFNVLEGIDRAASDEFQVTLFKQIAMKADLGDMIRYDADRRGFTIFIPTDDALRNKISSERLEELLNEQEAARYFVMFHMMDGRYTLMDIERLNGTQVMSMSQTPLSFMAAHNPQSQLELLVNGALIKSGAYAGSYGIVGYVIDAVVTP